MANYLPNGSDGFSNNVYSDLRSTLTSSPIIDESSCHLVESVIFSKAIITRAIVVDMRNPNFPGYSAREIDFTKSKFQEIISQLGDQKFSTCSKQSQVDFQSGRESEKLTKNLQEATRKVKLTEQHVPSHLELREWLRDLFDCKDRVEIGECLGTYKGKILSIPRTPTHFSPQEEAQRVAMSDNLQATHNRAPAQIIENLNSNCNKPLTDIGPASPAVRFVKGIPQNKMNLTEALGQNSYSNESGIFVENLSPLRPSLTKPVQFDTMQKFLTDMIAAMKDVMVKYLEIFEVYKTRVSNRENKNPQLSNCNDNISVEEQEKNQAKWLVEDFSDCMTSCKELVDMGKLALSELQVIEHIGAKIIKRYETIAINIKPSQVLPKPPDIYEQTMLGVRPMIYPLAEILISEKKAGR